MLINADQIRMIRSLINESREEFAESTSLSKTTIQKVENGDSPVTVKTAERVHRYAKKKGIVVTDAGQVGWRSDEPYYYTGKAEFMDFLDDVYEEVKDGGQICIGHVNARHWTDLTTPQEWQAHTERMEAIKNRISNRILIEEGDWFFPAKGFAEYRWLPKKYFNSDQTIYAYGDKLAHINFGDGDVHITVVQSAAHAQNFRIFFDIAWEKVAIIPPMDERPQYAR